MTKQPARVITETATSYLLEILPKPAFQSSELLHLSILIYLLPLSLMASIEITQSVTESNKTRWYFCGRIL